MKTFDIACLLICATYAVQTSEELGDNRHNDPDYQNNVHFLRHIFEHNLSYDTKAEFEYRKSVYISTDAWINQFRQEQGPDASFTVGHNKFSTWTDEEFAALFKGNAE